MRARPALAPVLAVVLPVVLALALPAGAAAAAEEGSDPGFAPLVIRIEGELLDTRFADMDGDGRKDLVTAVLARRPGLPARREIRIHMQAADRTLPLQPTRVVAVPDDVILYGFADVRDEPGRELLLMTRTGVHSLSPQVEGLRDNLRRLATRDLLYQVPDSRSLASWSYVVERRGQRDLLLVPGALGLSVWGPAPAGGAAAGGAAGTSPGGAPGASPAAGSPDGYAPIVELGGVPDSVFSAKSPGAVRASAGSVNISIDAGRSRGLFLDDVASAYALLLESEVRADAPALADLDGDGRRDLVFFDDVTLRARLGTDAGFTMESNRIENVPGWLEPGDGRLNVHLRDLDGDGDDDAYASVSPEQAGLAQVTFSYFVMLNDGQRLFPEQPQQVLRFEGNGTDSELTDVDADGRLDLVVTKYQMPSLGELAGGFKLTRSAFVFFGRGEGEPFERKPSIRDEQVFTIDSLQDALVQRRIAGDFSGDGLADLVEVDLTGHVVIRRIAFEDSFFGAGEWQVEETPWKRLDLGGDLKQMLLEDVNGDGLVDLINPGSETLTLVLSQRSGGAR